MKKKKIIIVTISLGNDGAERVLSLLSSKFIDDGYEVIILQTKPGYYGNGFRCDERISIVDLPYNGGNSTRRYFFEAKQLHDYLKRDQSATVLAFLAQSIFISVIAKIGLNNRLIVSERNDPRRCPAKRIQRIIRDISFHFADQIVFQTKTVQHMFPRSIQDKSVVIPNPVNPQLLEPYKGKRRHRIVTAGRLHPQKNLEMLFEAFALFHKQFDDYYLDVYGKGDLELKLKKKAKELGLSDKIIFHGFVTDLHEQIKDVAMYVCSSDYEGISNSILEAMAMGIPTISTDCPIGGSSLLIKNRINGFLVPVGSIEEMFRAMIEIAEDLELANKISRNAIKIREKFDINKVALEWEKIL